MHRVFLALGALLGAIAVGLGAFAAHGLKKVASADALSVFQTGVQYEMYHSLALLAVGIVFRRLPTTMVSAAGWLFAAGILFFSGSLYLITFFTVRHVAVPVAIGIITPIGGLFFMLGWLALFFGVLKRNSQGY